MKTNHVREKVKAGKPTIGAFLGLGSPNVAGLMAHAGFDWLVIETVGRASNRDGIGTRIELIVDGTKQIREIAAGGSQMGQNMLEAHFGLGKSELVETITLRWPSGQVQTLTGVAVNQRLTVTEPSGESVP